MTMKIKKELFNIFLYCFIKQIKKNVLFCFHIFFVGFRLKIHDTWISMVCCKCFQSTVDKQCKQMQQNEVRG